MSALWDRQSPDYWRERQANAVVRRKMHMDEARWAASHNDDNGVDFNVGMAIDASWDVRWAKRQLRKLEQVTA